MDGLYLRLYIIRYGFKVKSHHVIPFSADSAVTHVHGSGLVSLPLYGRPDRYFDRGPAPLRSPAPHTHAQSSQHVPPERSGPKAQRPMPRPPLSRLLSTTALWCVEAGGPVGRPLRSPAHPAPPRRCPIPSLVSHATRQAISKQAHAMAKAMADYQHARWVGASKIAML